MNCERVKSLLMDYLYDELDEATKKEFLVALKSCPEVEQEIVELQRTQQALRMLPEAEPPERLVFSTPASRSWRERWQAFTELLPTGGFGRAGLAAASLAMMLLVVGSLANIEMSVQNGEFSMRMGVMPRAQASLSAESQQAILAALRAENKTYINQLARVELAGQEDRLQKLVESYANDLSRQRQADLEMISQGFDAMQSDTRTKLRESQQVFEDLIRNVQFQQRR